jgi:signal transduction histidine kinase
MKRREAVAGLIIGGLVVLALMAVFAVQLSDNQAQSKQDIQSRVHERSVLAAALIDSLFQSVQRQTPQQARLYGAREVPNSLLESKRAQNAYIVLLNSAGRPLAYSRGFNAQARDDLRRSATLMLLEGGKPWALGNVLPYGRTGVINFGVALPTKSGTRYLLTGFRPSVLGPFMLGELQQIPGVKGAYNYIFDGNGVVISSTNPHRPPGYRLHTPSQVSAFAHSSGDVNGHYYDQVRLSNSTWRILLAAPNGPLFASVSGLRKWLPWLLFAAFGFVAGLTLILARRALRDSDRLRATNTQLADSNSKLERANVKLADMNTALADSNSALEATNVELARRADELARSNAELDQFASIASHDLQEPLRKVRTFTERIVQTEGDALSERGLDYLRRANASAERMQRLIEDLLKFSRVATQGRPFGPVDLGAITREVVEDLEDPINGAGAEIRIGELPTINADAHQMRQLVQNLISNAIKFHRDGVKPEVEISAEQTGDFVKLTVRDNGIGFDRQYRGRIFRVFERLHGRGTYPGTGIGLALCRKIAERHGGTVVADSVPGQGSVFIVTLQAKRSEAVVRPPSSEDDGSAPSSSEEPYVVA